MKRTRVSIHLERRQDEVCFCPEKFYSEHLGSLLLMGEFTTLTGTPIIVRPFIPPL